MAPKKALYIYPITNEPYKAGGNSYIRNLIAHLSPTFTIVNKKTNIGLLDMLLKLPNCDVLYFNWIEDVVERRFGFLQVALLTAILFLAKLLNIKIVWFIHNNLSHSRRHEGLKKFIVRRMRQAADVILSHANELTLDIPRNKFHAFDHPIEAYQPLSSSEPYAYDVLIWGSVSPYKGITQFVDFVSSSAALKDIRILIAGKFNSDGYYEEIKSTKTANIEIRNQVIPETELNDLLKKSRYVLFTYNSPSVLSSAALCKTLSFGKDVVGPNIGSFKELGSKHLLYNYSSFSELAKLLDNLKSGQVKTLDKKLLHDYAMDTSWDKFAAFVTEIIRDIFKGKRLSQRTQLNKTVQSSSEGLRSTSVEQLP